MGKKQRKRENSKMKSASWKILLILAAFLVVLLAVGTYGYRSYNAFLRQIPRAEQAAASLSESIPEIETQELALNGDPIVNILLIGQSAREGELYHNADSVILATVNKETKTLTFTSFLRDAYLRLPDYVDGSGVLHPGSMQRLNVCYHLGHSYGTTGDAMAMLDQCLYENFGIEVDHNIEIGFIGVEKIVDFFGGIEVELTQAEADYLNADDLYVLYDVQPGMQVLNGTATLSYIRMRNAEGDGGSDIKRTARQRLVLGKLVDKIRHVSVSDMEVLLREFMPYLLTDMSDEDITKCLMELVPLLPQLTIETGTCPAQGTFWAELTDLGGFDSMVIRYEEEENRQRMKLLTEGN